MRPCVSYFSRESHVDDRVNVDRRPLGCEAELTAKIAESGYPNNVGRIRRQTLDRKEANCRIRLSRPLAAAYDDSTRRGFGLFTVNWEVAMHFIAWIVFGGLVGAIARLLMPGRQPMGIILTILLGVAGSFLGGWFGNMLHGGPADVWQPASWLGAILGAFLLLFIYGMVTRRSA